MKYGKTLKTDNKLSRAVKCYLTTVPEIKNQENFYKDKVPKFVST